MSNIEFSSNYDQGEIQPLDPQDEPRTTNQLHTQRTGKNVCLNQFERLKRIGTGQHGEVYVAWDNNNGTLVVRTLPGSHRMSSIIK